MTYELGIIGAGNMAEAIVKAAIAGKIVEPAAIVVADPMPQRREVFAELGVAVMEANAPVIAEAAQVMLAVKPQTLPHLADDLAQIDRQKQIVLSIMAGVRIAKIEAAAGGPARVVRIMPNTPMLVGVGMAAIAPGPNAHEGDELLAMQLFRAGGEAIVVDESLLDAVTAVSGSGPAYIFYLAEAMAEAADSLGLSPEHAALLTQQTVLGAATLMSKSNDPPAELRRKVTSPGGTTQAACEHLDKTRVRQHIVAAITKAAERSKELGR